MTEVDSQEPALPSPRFDEVAARMARPVVPLADEAYISTNPRFTINIESQHAPLLSKKGSWLLAAVVGLIMAAGAMAISLTTYRRNQAVVSTQALVPAADAIQMEMDQKLRRGRSSPAAAAAPATAPTTVAKTKKPERRAASAVAARPAVNRNPHARLVDSYVVR